MEQGYFEAPDWQKGYLNSSPIICVSCTVHAYFYPPFIPSVGPPPPPFITQTVKEKHNKPEAGTEPWLMPKATYLDPLIRQSSTQAGALQQIKEVVTGFPLLLGHRAARDLRIQVGDCHLRACRLLRCPRPVLSHRPHRSASAFQGHHRPGKALGGAARQHLSTRISHFFFRKSLHLQHVRHRNAEASVQGVDPPLYYFARPLLCPLHT